MLENAFEQISPHWWSRPPVDMKPYHDVSSSLQKASGAFNHLNLIQLSQQNIGLDDVFDTAKRFCPPTLQFLFRCISINARGRNQMEASGGNSPMNKSDDCRESGTKNHT